MAIMGFNPAMEMQQIRRQQTLAMSGGAAPAAAAPAGATSTQVQQMAAAAGAGSEGAAQAGMAAQAVQPTPPQTSKIVLGSVLKGAMTGASVALGFKQFGPLLGKIPMLGKLGASALGFLGKIPLLGKLVPLLGKTGIGGFLIAGAIGAGVGAIFGAFSGIKKAKAQGAEYAQAMADAQAQAEAQAQAQAQAQPQEAAGKPVGAASAKKNPTMDSSYTGTAGASGRHFKSWVTAKSGSRANPAGPGHATITVKRGDTVSSLAKRYHTTVKAIVSANKQTLSNPDKIAVGAQIRIPRSMVRAA